LAAKITNLRLDRGIWQSDLAKACGITGSALSRIENGVVDTQAATLSAIARALCVPIDYLLDETQPYPYVPPGTNSTGVGKKPKDKVRMNVTQGEKWLIEKMRKMKKSERELLRAVPGLGLQELVIAYSIITGRPSSGVAARIIDELGESPGQP